MGSHLSKSNPFWATPTCVQCNWKRSLLWTQEGWIYQAGAIFPSLQVSPSLAQAKQSSTATRAGLLLCLRGECTNPRNEGMKSGTKHTFIWSLHFGLRGPQWIYDPEITQLPQEQPLEVHLGVLQTLSEFQCSVGKDVMLPKSNPSCFRGVMCPCTSTPGTAVCRALRRTATSMNSSVAQWLMHFWKHLSSPTHLAPELSFLIYSSKNTFTPALKESLKTQNLKMRSQMRTLPLLLQTAWERQSSKA